MSDTIDNTDAAIDVTDVAIDDTDAFTTDKSNKLLPLIRYHNYLIVLRVVTVWQGCRSLISLSS
jgi:hypothetical protein